MNHHDIRLIEIGQKEGYAKAVKEIVAWLRDTSKEPQLTDEAQSALIYVAGFIAAKFGGSDGQRHED